MNLSACVLFIWCSHDIGRPFHREVPELIETLRKHMRLLHEFCRRAFQEHDSDYLGEVVGKLRLLVYERGSNKPLLLRLMNEFEINVPFRLNGPPMVRPPGHVGPWYSDEISLRDYLDLPAYGICTSSQGFVELTINELIATWADKHGSTHEDWTLKEEFATARDSGVFVNRLPILAVQLNVIARTVLSIAEKFLSMLTDELVELKTADRYLQRHPHSLPACSARGSELGKLGRYEEAIEEFQRIIKADQTNSIAYNALGLGFTI